MIPPKVLIDKYQEPYSVGQGIPKSGWLQESIPIDLYLSTAIKEVRHPRQQAKSHSALYTLQHTLY